MGPRFTWLFLFYLVYVTDSPDIVYYSTKEVTVVRIFMFGWLCPDTYFVVPTSMLSSARSTDGV